MVVKQWVSNLGTILTPSLSMFQESSARCLSPKTAQRESRPAPLRLSWIPLRSRYLGGSEELM